MAKIRTVEKLQAQLTGAEAASRKHKAENDALVDRNKEIADALGKVLVEKHKA